MNKKQSGIIRFLSLLLTTVSVFWGLIVWFGKGQQMVGILFIFVLPLALIAAVFQHRRREKRKNKSDLG